MCCFYQHFVEKMEGCVGICSGSRFSLLGTSLSPSTCCLRSNMEDVMPVKVKINAPNLMSLTFSNRLPEDFCVHSFPLLQDAELYYNFSDIKTRFIPLSNFIMKLCNVKVLKLSGVYFEVLKLAEVVSTSFPTFDNLIRLEVYDIHCVQMKTLLDFLDFSPNLKSLVINEVEFSGKINENTMKFHKAPLGAGEH